MKEIQAVCDELAKFDGDKLNQLPNFTRGSY